MIQENFEVESNCSVRLSFVPSQPAASPRSRSMLSRDKRLPLDTWNTSGLQGNVFGFQFFCIRFVPKYHPQGISSDNTPHCMHQTSIAGSFHTLDWRHSAPSQQWFTAVSMADSLTEQSGASEQSSSGQSAARNRVCSSEPQSRRKQCLAMWSLGWTSLAPSWLRSVTCVVLSQSGQHDGIAA